MFLISLVDQELPLSGQNQHFADVPSAHEPVVGPVTLERSVGGLNTVIAKFWSRLLCWLLKSGLGLYFQSELGILVSQTRGSESPCIC